MVQIGRPHDPVATAKKKEAALKDALNTRSRAWHSYVKLLSQAYGSAYELHTHTLSGIKEKIRSDTEFLRAVLFGAVLPSALGGAMAVLVSDGGKKMLDGLYTVAKNSQNQKLLLDMGVGGANSIAKDVTKLYSAKMLNDLVPSFGDEWDAVATQPFQFFLGLDKTIDDFGTDAIAEIERLKSNITMNNIDDYIAKIDAYLLSPFIQKAPMDRTRLYSDKDLQIPFEIFMWVYWAKTRNTQKWQTNIERSLAPDDRSMVGKIWDAAWLNDDDVERSQADYAEAQLDPILVRLLTCRIPMAEITQPYGEHPDRRFLNVLWVRMLGQKHRGTLLGDLVDAMDAKGPQQIFDGGTVTKDRALI